MIGSRAINLTNEKSPLWTHSEGSVQCVERGPYFHYCPARACTLFLLKCAVRHGGALRLRSPYIGRKTHYLPSPTPPHMLALGRLWRGVRSGSSRADLARRKHFRTHPNTQPNEQRTHESSSGRCSRPIPVHPLQQPLDEKLLLHLRED